MAGTLPQLKPFVATFWAALATTNATDDYIFTQQVAIGLVWLRALFRAKEPLFHRRWFGRPATQVVLVTDASPFGGGALLYVVPADTVIDRNFVTGARPWA